MWYAMVRRLLVVGNSVPARTSASANRASNQRLKRHNQRVQNANRTYQTVRPHVSANGVSEINVRHPGFNRREKAYRLTVQSTTVQVYEEQQGTNHSQVSRRNSNAHVQTSGIGGDG